KIREPQAGNGDVPFHEADASREPRLAGHDLLGPLAGEGSELGLHEAYGLIGFGAGQHAGHELRAQETGKTGEELNGHFISPRCLPGRARQRRPGTCRKTLSVTLRARLKISSVTPAGAASGRPRWMAIVCGSVYLRMPSAPWRRPRPESLKPPMGASTEAQAAA